MRILEVHFQEEGVQLVGRFRADLSVKRVLRKDVKRCSADALAELTHAHKRTTK